MPYILKTQKQIDVLRLLVDGQSISGVSRFTGIHRDTISRCMVRFGMACRAFLDREMRDLQFNHLELDEIWTFNRKKVRKVTGEEPDWDEIGDIYIFVALDEDTRLVPAYRVGKRDQVNTNVFIDDLSKRLKMPTPHESDAHAFQPGGYKPIVRISTDAFPAYAWAIDAFFGKNVTYAQVVKKHLKTKKQVVIKKRQVIGKIDDDDISTSLVERGNLTIRTLMRRLVRRTLCFSKKLENLKAATAMHFAFYNYCWRVKTLKTTPAVAAGISPHPMDFRVLYQHVRDYSPELFLDTAHSAR